MLLVPHRDPKLNRSQIRKGCEKPAGLACWLAGPFQTIVTVVLQNEARNPGDGQKPCLLRRGQFSVICAAWQGSPLHYRRRRAGRPALFASAAVLAVSIAGDPVVVVVILGIAVTTTVAVAAALTVDIVGAVQSSSSEGWQSPSQEPEMLWLALSCDQDCRGSSARSFAS
ncbi:hypothetical protein CRV24_006343 [Beauveria bassiana]|nr:hypothetical protein CRV24_006343 [Beauveria bassiana]